MMGDLIIGTFASGTTTTGVHTMLTKGDDYYNNHGYRCYIYAGTNIGSEREVSDWTLTSPANTLTFSPAFGSAIDNTSAYELHEKFTAGDYLRAINMAIESIAGKYLVDIKDTTTIRLTSITDNLGDTIYTYEYSLPTSMLYLYKVTVEEAVSGYKLTGTVSGTFTAGETVTGGTSGATGELAYGVTGGTYIRVRKVSGSFSVGETATGGTSGETCSAITAVESESAGMGVWYAEDEVDPRDWWIRKAYPSKLVLNESYISSFDEDLYLLLEGQGTQPIVDDDTDTIYLPPDWLIAEAVLHLPYAKILSNKLEGVYVKAARDAEYWRQRGGNHPHHRARNVVE